MSGYEILTCILLGIIIAEFIAFACLINMMRRNFNALKYEYYGVLLRNGLLEGVLDGNKMEET